MLPLGTFWGWTPWEDQNLFLTPKCTTTIPVIFIWESPRGCKPGSGGSRTFSLTQLMANAVENYLIAPIFLDIADLLLSNYAKNKVFRQKGRNKFYLKSLRQNAIDIIPGNVTGRKETAAFAFVISQTNSGLKWQPTYDDHFKVVLLKCLSHHLVLWIPWREKIEIKSEGTQSIRFWRSCWISATCPDLSETKKCSNKSVCYQSCSYLMQ